MSDQQFPSEPPSNYSNTTPGNSGFDASQPYVPPVDPQPTYQQEQPYAAPQYQAQQPYAAPYPGYVAPMVLPDHPSATPSLVLGILSLVVCGITSPFGLYMAVKGRKEVAANPTAYRSGGSLTAGFVLNIIGLVGLAFWLVYFIFWLIVFVGLTAGASSYR